VSDAPPLLTRQLLEQLEERWRAQNAPIAHHLQPGLSEPEMATIMAPLGLAVPAEARTWFGWHDGARSDGVAINWTMTGLGWKFFPLSHAVEEATEQRTRARQIAGERADALLWRDAWLPLADNFHAGVIVVDATAPADRRETPVYYTEPELGTRAGAPRAATLGQMVTWWIEAIDEHVIDYDSSTGDWRYAVDQLDPQRERTRLV
jgi:cell wall assembly regulator SMI1